MKAIETEYKGYRFRSRLEARWAVFFEALGVKWLYEHEGYETKEGWYLPDFYLPNDRLIVEVKGSRDLDAFYKAAALFNDMPKGVENVLIVEGLPTRDKGPSLNVLMWIGGLTTARVDDAMRKAKAARFEHGESP